MTDLATATQLAAIGLSGIAGTALAALFRGVSVSPFAVFCASLGPMALAWLAAPLPLAAGPLAWSLVLVAGLTCLAAFDGATRTVPDIVTVPMIVLGVVHAMAVGAPHLLFGLSAVGLILFSVGLYALLRGRGPWVGGGDVLLVAGALAWFGPSLIPDLMVLATIILWLQLVPRLARLPRADACIPATLHGPVEIPLAPALAVAELVIWFGGPLF